MKTLTPSAMSSRAGGHDAQGMEQCVSSSGGWMRPWKYYSPRTRKPRAVKLCHREASNASPTLPVRRLLVNGREEGLIATGHFRPQTVAVTEMPPFFRVIDQPFGLQSVAEKFPVGRLLFAKQRVLGFCFGIKFLNFGSHGVWRARVRTQADVNGRASLMTAAEPVGICDESFCFYPVLRRRPVRVLMFDLQHDVIPQRDLSLTGAKGFKEDEPAILRQPPFGSDDLFDYDPAQTEFSGKFSTKEKRADRGHFNKIGGIFAFANMNAVDDSIKQDALLLCLRSASDERWGWLAVDGGQRNRCDTKKGPILVQQRHGPT